MSPCCLLTPFLPILPIAHAILVTLSLLLKHASTFISEPLPMLFLLFQSLLLRYNYASLPDVLLSYKDALFKIVYSVALSITVCLHPLH